MSGALSPFAVFRRKRSGVDGGGRGDVRVEAPAAAEALLRSLAHRLSGFRKSVGITSKGGKTQVRVDTSPAPASEQRAAEEAGRELDELLELLCGDVADAEREPLLQLLLPIVPLLIVFLPRLGRSGMQLAAAVFCKLVYLAEHGGGCNAVVEYILENRMLLDVLVALATLSAAEAVGGNAMAAGAGGGITSPGDTSSSDYRTPERASTSASTTPTGTTTQSGLADGTKRKPRVQYTYISEKKAMQTPGSASEFGKSGIATPPAAAFTEHELRAHAASMLKCCLGLSADLAIAILDADELFARIIDAIAAHASGGWSADLMLTAADTYGGSAKPRRRKRRNEFVDTMFDLLHDILLTHSGSIPSFLLSRTRASSSCSSSSTQSASPSPSGAHTILASEDAPGTDGAVGMDNFGRFFAHYKRLLCVNDSAVRVSSVRVLAELICRRCAADRSVPLISMPTTAAATTTNASISSLLATAAANSRKDDLKSDLYLLYRFLEDVENVRLLSRLMVTTSPSSTTRRAPFGSSRMGSDADDGDDVQAEVLRTLLPTIVTNARASTAALEHEELLVEACVGDFMDAIDAGLQSIALETYLLRGIQALSTPSAASVDNENILHIVLSFVEVLAERVIVPTTVVDFVDRLLSMIAEARIAMVDGDAANTIVGGVGVRSDVTSTAATATSAADAAAARAMNSLLLPNFSMHNDTLGGGLEEDSNERSGAALAHTSAVIDELMCRTVGVLELLVDHSSVGTVARNAVLAGDGASVDNMIILESSGISISLARIIDCFPKSKAAHRARRLAASLDGDEARGPGDIVPECGTTEVRATLTSAAHAEGDAAAPPPPGADADGVVMHVRGEDFGLELVRTCRFGEYDDSAGVGYIVGRMSHIRDVDDYDAAITSKLHLRVALECVLRLAPVGVANDSKSHAADGGVMSPLPSTIFGVEVLVAPPHSGNDISSTWASSSAAVPYLRRRQGKDGDDAAGPSECTLMVSLPFSSPTSHMFVHAESNSHAHCRVQLSVMQDTTDTSSEYGEYVVALPPMPLRIEDKMLPVHPGIAAALRCPVDGGASLFDSLWSRCDARGVSAKKLVYIKDAGRLLRRLCGGRGKHDDDDDDALHASSFLSSDSPSPLSRLQQLVIDDVAGIDICDDCSLRTDAEHSGDNTLQELRLCAWIPPRQHLLLVLAVVVGVVDIGAMGDAEGGRGGACAIVRACTDCPDLFLDGGFDAFLDAALLA